MYTLQKKQLAGNFVIVDFRPHNYSESLKWEELDWGDDTLL